MAGSLSDLTHRKTTKDALRIDKEQAEEVTKTKSQFLDNTSHALRTPMNAIIGITEMSAEEAEERHHSRALEPLQRVNAASRHLLRFINDNLDLSKIEAGRSALEGQTFDLHSSLDEVMATAHTLAENKKTHYD